LGATATGRTAPDVFIFDVRHAEGGLADDPAHAKVYHPIPRTDRITQPTLIAAVEGLAAVGLDFIDDLFVVGYRLHCVFYPFFSKDPEFGHGEITAISG
jgi:hypothetical protein